MTHNFHDSGYRKLFSNTTIFKQLLETFVNQDWVKDVDFDSATPLNRTFVSNEYKERETDLIQKVKIKNQDAYIYILIEFQSSIQKFMAVRVLHYITNFYIYYIENNKNVSKLPVVFPIVLYNGDNKWTAPENINNLIDNNILLNEYGLNFKYFKISENDYSKDFLIKASNIVSTLFLTEAHFDIEVIKKAFEELFDKESDKQAMSIFFNWYEQYTNNSKMDSSNFNEIAKVYTNKSEVKSMLSTALEKQRNSFKEEGKAEGRAEGRAEGKAEGKLEAIKNLSEKLLSKKIGSLPIEIKSKIDSCNDVKKLEKIVDNIFDISDFSEVEELLK